MRKFLLFFLLMVLLTGCSPIIEQNPLPSPRIVSISLSDTLEPSQKETISSCAAHSPNLALVFLNGNTADFPDLQIIIRKPNAEFQGSAIALGKESVIVIAHPENKLNEIDRTQLIEIYSAPNLDEHQIWTYPKENELRNFFNQTILHGAEISPYAVIAPNIEAMRRAVSENPNAIGYIPTAWFDSRVKKINLFFENDNQTQYPIIALTEIEPDNDLIKYLLCVQDSFK